MNYVDALENVAHAARRLVGLEDFTELREALATLDATPYFRADRIDVEPPVGPVTFTRDFIYSPVRHRLALVVVDRARVVRNVSGGLDAALADFDAETG